MYNNGNSSKNVTGASVVDGTLYTVDIADDAVTADKLANSINTDIATGVSGSTTAGNALPKTGGAMTGAITGFESSASNAGGIARAALFTNNGAAVNSQAQILLVSGGNTTRGAGVSVLNESTSGQPASLILSTSAAYAAPTERMRINSTGQALIGTTTAEGTSKLTSKSTVNGSWASASIGTDYAKSSRVTSGVGYADFFYTGTGSTYAGYIYANGESVTYATSSDYRLKENVSPMVGSINRLKALKPSTFNFIKNADKTVDGFLAHEAQAVVPECVHGAKDAMKDEEYEVTPAVMDGEDLVTEAVMGTRSVPDYQGIDQAKLVPLLVAALQEAIYRIETLENT